MSDSKKTENLRKTLECRVASARSSIIDFSQKVVEEPMKTMKWSSNAFYSAAQIELYDYLLQQLSLGATVENILNMVKTFALISISTSSSETDTMANRAKQQVAASLLNENFLKYYC